jgi:hypothetical protein
VGCSIGNVHLEITKSDYLRGNVVLDSHGVN